MIDSETVVGTGLRITVSRDELSSKLAVVTPRRLHSRNGARAGRHPVARRVREAASSPPPTWRCRCAARSTRRSRTKARSSCRVACCSTSRGRCRTARSRSKRRPDELAVVVVAAGGARSDELHLRLQRGFPAPAGGRRGALHTVDRDALVETVATGRGGSASRDEKPPCAPRGISRPLRNQQDRDGGDRLVPAAVKETPVTGTLPDLESDHPGARSAGAGAASRRSAPTRSSSDTGRRTTTASAPAAPAGTPAIDGTVPELPPAASQRLESRYPPPARGGAVRGAYGASPLMAQRNPAAPAPVRRGRGRPSRRSRRTSARMGNASRCRPRSPEGRDGDRVRRRVLARRARVGRLGRDQVAS